MHHQCRCCVSVEGGVLTYRDFEDKQRQMVATSRQQCMVAVNWSGAATAGVDTSALPSSVTISGGTSSTNFTVTATDDYLKEGSESLIATITGVTDK